MRVRGALKAAALLTSLWATPLWAKKDGPTIHVNEFKHFPQNLNYFEDSDVIIFQDTYDNNVYRSEDAGSTWERVSTIPDGAAWVLFMHDYDHDRAYVMTEGIQHYKTSDRGKTWDLFLSDAEISMFRPDTLQFNAGNPDHIIFNGMDCQGIFCEEVAMYTTDGFRTAAKFLRGNTAGCWWAKSSHLFATGQSDLDDRRILCIVRDSFSPFKQDQRLLISDNFFSAEKADGAIQEFEPDLDMDRPAQGIVNIAVVKKYLLVATTSVNTDEMALFVTDDTIKWHRAMFPTDHRVNQEAYTVLESTNYSIQIDVMTTRPGNPMGVMFTSNSNGTYFTRNIEHTNRNDRGHVDFEKITGIQGIFLVNTVDNWEEVAKNSMGARKKVVSEISFDDGRTFESVTADGMRIHLHSVTELSNTGRVFSSPAPGLVMGVGNTGDYLKPYQDGSLYISDDAGLTWIAGPEGPHKYEFGDQGSVLLAVRDSDSTGEIKYSLNHGKDWIPVDLPDNLKIKPWFLTTTQDSTSLKFLLVGESGVETKPAYQIIAIDFDGLHEDTCKESDMEDWYARVDDKKNLTCLMGHTQKYHRRKKDAECFLKQEFKDPVVETTDCDCTDADFECDYNFVRDGDKCIAIGPVVAPEEACKNAGPDDTFKGSSGWRMIPGDTCKRISGQPQKDDLVERKCSESHRPPSAPASGKIDHIQHVFDGDWDGVEKHYLERGESSSTNDETIIARGTRGNNHAGKIYITQDHGKTWTHPDELDVPIWSILPHYYFKDMVFFVTLKEEVLYTIDRGLNFHSFKPPYPPATDPPRNPLAFHPDKKDYLIWLGEKCDGGKSCFLEASFSKDRGDSWTTIARYVDRCEFTGSSAYKFRDINQIVCLERTREENMPDNNPWQLVSSNDFFDTKEIRENYVKDFATMAEFIVVATEDSDRESLRALASLDGETYAEAQFPYNFKVPHQHGYTVLDSSTHAVNLFVVTEMKPDGKYGTIIKSNSNGTSYVLSVGGVNCNDQLYVDFEKMLGLEGVILVNIVANRDSANEPKRLLTMISHNDGAEWAYLAPPARDIDGKAYSCSSAKGDESCALHIHGFTEREDHRKTYSSEGAVGLMFGWGNVGSQLSAPDEADTFMTSDAGMTWRNVKKGRWTWQFGDQGSIIVLVQTSFRGNNVKTNTLSYSTDEGATWTDYQFSDREVEILDITTLRSGSSRNFVLWGQSADAGLFSINVDFSGLTDRPCTQSDDLGESDYRLWSPKHPMQDDDCLFGHVAQYLRKKTDRSCYNGFKIQHLYNIKNCTCSRRDFECDYNYELDNHGSCHLIDGLVPMSREQWCSEHPDAIEWFEPNGYRRIPLTTCGGGTELDKALNSHPCRGHEDEYERKHSGLSGAALFFAIVLPFAAAAAVGWWVWRNWSSKFGQIRLGESGGGGLSGALDSDAPWVRYPVIAVAAVVAVVGAVPVVLKALWRTGRGAAERWGWVDSGRGAWSRLGGGGVGAGLGRGGTRPFTTRDSFARGRGDYAVVDEDEGELLGEDSDEEV